MSKQTFNPKPLKELSHEQMHTLEGLAVTLTLQHVADYFMISLRTLHRILKRQPEAMARYKKGKAGAIAIMGNSVFQRGKDGNDACAIFYLKSQAGWRERPVEHGDDDAPPPSKIIIKSYDGRKPSDS